ncbi:hypothetical protein [Shimazuella alba]|uniref:Uncharacterized protein n=1 Tax=Shimazuella alba TaxID=2690964 RepID=A0A6I4VSF9_9BACL|nr:hypothetical protein [Shimazuella alba]MXQ54517.1 hypothetical protein [Shimazuella alba]
MAEMPDFAGLWKEQGNIWGVSIIQKSIEKTRYDVGKYDDPKLHFIEKENLLQADTKA